MFLNALGDIWSKVVDFFANLSTNLSNVFTTQIIIYVVLVEALLILILFIMLICEMSRRRKLEKKNKKAEATESGEKISTLSNRAYKKQMKELEKQAEYEAVKASFAKENPNALPKKEEKKEEPKAEEPKKEEAPVVAASAPANVDTSEIDAKIEKERIYIALLEYEAELLKDLEERRAREKEAQEEAETKQKAQENFDDFLSSIGAKKKKEENPYVEEEPVSVATQVEIPEEELEELEEEELEEDEEEDIEEEELAEEEEAEEESVEEPQTKEASIEVQEFVAVDSEGKPKKIRRKFNTKMMYAPYETKKCYNEIKNHLMSYRAKGRMSSRCETFRYKGLVSKLVLGGKALKVYLALDPSVIDQYPKYHLKDFSAKKQYAEVPVMIRVRSERSLKYCKELIDLLFANRLVKPKKNFEPENYLPSLIPNGEAILANLGLETYYLQYTMNPNGIPEEMPDDLIDYIPTIPDEPLEEEEVEAVAYLDTLCNHFEDGDEITLDVLKSMHICQKGNVLRIKARGTLDRKLIIYAEYYDDDALKMLLCTNGTAVRIVRNTEE